MCMTVLDVEFDRGFLPRARPGPTAISTARLRKLAPATTAGLTMKQVEPDRAYLSIPFCLDNPEESSIEKDSTSTVSSDQLCVLRLFNHDPLLLDFGNVQNGSSGRFIGARVFFGQ